MAIPDEEVVRAVLARDDRDVACRQAVEVAWDAVVTEYPNRAWYRRKSTTRALIWEHSIDNAVSAFNGKQGARIIQENDTYSFLFDDSVLLRYKKATIQLISSNYPTISASLFHQHEPDLFGHLGLHRVEVVHVFNRFETAIDWIGVVARQGKEVLWSFELRAGDRVVLPLPKNDALRPAADTVLRQAKAASNKAPGEIPKSEGE